uniref:Uncharacterized protein n=1 Tax=Physcomitrium patens TaxID=3218 RepID=A0A2K1JUU7_PHYPA|nr:hypothetical protein PHYPA_015057 [Physcomitrium patens]
MASQWGKMNTPAKSTRSSQRFPTAQKSCYALEPVLENCEIPSEKRCKVAPAACSVQGRKTAKPVRILLKLRDRYVKLMNGVATGTEMVGMSSFYTYPGHCYLSTVAKTQSAKEEEKKEISYCMQVHMAHSR